MYGNQEVLYVLELEHHKYYVGRTQKPFEERFQEYISGKRTNEWIKLHKPIRVMYVKPYKRFLERNTTFEMMYIYGIDNVRGGEWCHPFLTAKERQHILAGFEYEEGRCYICESITHYSPGCPFKPSTKYFCDRCHHEGHTADDCCAILKLDGMSVSSGLIDD